MNKLDKLIKKAEAFHGEIEAYKTRYINEITKLHLEIDELRSEIQKMNTVAAPELSSSITSKNKNHFEGVRTLLKHIEENKGTIDSFALHKGIRECVSSDKGYIDGISSRIPDGTFSIEINGELGNKK